MRKAIRSDLIEFRNKLNLTQTEFARRLGMHNSQLSKYESGRREPTAKTWRSMVLCARQFGIELPESLFFKEEVKKNEVIIFRADSVKQMREYLGKDQLEVAKELGIHPRRWGRYERGECVPPMTLWIKIQRYAQQFGIQLGVK